MANKLYITYDMFTITSAATLVSDNQIIEDFRIILDRIDVDILTEICKSKNIDKIDEIIISYSCPKEVIDKYKQLLETKLNDKIKITIVD